MATVATLRDLFLDEVKDLLNAERQLVKALPKMINAAFSDELREALTAHLAETEGHVTRLEEVLTGLGEAARGKKCKGMEGILEEGSDMLEEVEMPALDAAIISSGQRVEHYEICGYGVILAWARQLGYTEAASLISATLEEEKAANEKLSALAEGGINAFAAEPAESSAN